MGPGNDALIAGARTAAEVARTEHTSVVSAT